MTAGGLPDGAAEIHDIKGLFGLYAWYQPGVWLGVALALLVVAIFWLRRRRRPRVEAPPAPPRSPHAVALEALAGLKEQHEPKPFHFQLSEILRAYCEARFRFPATDRTLEEIQEMVVECAGLSAGERENLLSLLKRADLVKFTDYHPEREQSLELLARAEAFVRASRPVPGPGPEEGGP